MCRQIAERRQSLDHYNKASSALGAAIESDQVKVDGYQLKPAANADNLIYKRAFGVATDVWRNNGFDKCESRDIFVKKLNEAVADAQL